MNLKNKKVLVLGLGITGVSTIKALDKMGAKILISDTQNKDLLLDVLSKISHIKADIYLGSDDIDLNGIDLIIKSPGIPPFAKIVKKALDSKIDIITDIEFAYRISPTENLIAITGSNGKTTTTILTGEIFKKAKYKTNIVGNIGVGILDKMIEADEDDLFIIEASSFQLEHTKDFKPKVSLILNIRPDHLDWHGSFENYTKAKLNILKNQDSSDFSILNYNDPILKSLKDDLKSNIIWFSTDQKLEKGIYIEDENIIFDDGDKKTKIIQKDKIKLILENALGIIGIAISMGIDVDTISHVLENFKGLEHRIEFVTKINGVSYYNDSKGTNPEASIKAIEAIDAPIILIAGGYDKGSTYDDFIKSFNNKVKLLIILGQTKEKIMQAAIFNGFNKIQLVETMEEALKVACKNAESGDNVLLSPACASWGMYKNFEERGKDFKNEVYKLME